jgi:heme A synthase
MDLISLLIMIVVFVAVVWLAIWIVQKTLPAEVQKIALAIVGIIALLALLGMVTGHVPLLRYR